MKRLESFGSSERDGTKTPASCMAQDLRFEQWSKSWQRFEEKYCGLRKTSRRGLREVSVVCAHVENDTSLTQLN